MRRTSKTENEGKNIAAYVGIDWADAEHEIRMKVVETGQVETFQLKQTAESLAEWVQSLRNRFEGQKVAIAVEQRRGALIYALMTYEFLILYPVNPTTLAAYRKAFKLSGAKSLTLKIPICFWI